MLTDAEFARYCQTLSLSQSAIEQATLIRNSNPARRVQGRGNNVCARYPSHKMGRTIQAESRTVELVAIRCAYEFNSNVIEYWDQPCRLKLTYTAKSGKAVTVSHTPDFFVLYADKIGWEEWKPAAQMSQLADKMPARYQQHPDGHWICPPGEAAAAPYRFFYSVRTGAEFTPHYQRNVALLEDYLLPSNIQVDAVVRQQIIALVLAQPGITLAALSQQFDNDVLFTAIAHGDIFAHLHTVSLTNPQQVTLFASSHALSNNPPPSLAHTQVELAARLQVGTVLLWDERSWTVVNLGTERIAIQLADASNAVTELGWAEFTQLVGHQRIILPTHTLSTDEIASRIRHASPATLQRAVGRVKLVQAHLAGQPTTCPSRTLRRYVRRYLTAQSLYGSGLLGLLDKQHLKGNRSPRLQPKALELLEAAIADDYETLKQKPMRHVYNAYAHQCHSQAVTPASYMTFTQHVKRRPRQQQVAKRQGKRAAYQQGAQQWWLSHGTPRHGDFPWQLCHIDHTQLNLEVVCATTTQSLGRPWLTLLQDAFSRRILAIVLTFDPPSYRTCMTLLITCVQRHQRLPQQIIVDNGADFRSHYFEALLAHYSVTKLERPSGKPRFGSLIERLFRTSETELIHNLRGNTQMMKEPRLVTKSINPKNLAVWTLPELHTLFCRWAFEIYDQMIHTTLGQSPRAAFVDGLNRFGQRPHRHIAYDDSFRILSLPSTPRGSAKIQPGRGVCIHYLYYWCDAFRQHHNARVSVKYDPFDTGIAFAFVNGVWERCICEKYAVFQGRSEREMRLAATLLRQQLRRNRQRTELNAHLLATFLASAEGQETLLEQQLKDRATQTVEPHDDDNASTATPVETASSSVVVSTNAVTLKLYGALEL